MWVMKCRRGIYLMSIHEVVQKRRKWTACSTKCHRTHIMKLLKRIFRSYNFFQRKPPTFTILIHIAYFYHYNKLDLFQPTFLWGWLKSAETITKKWGVGVSLISFISRVIKILEINLYNPWSYLLKLGGLVFTLQR